VPAVVTDLMAVFAEPLEFRVVDVNPAAAEIAVAFGEAANRGHGRQDRFVATTDRREALRGADAVVLTLSVGGLDALEQDLAIPEKYGIYATVGDTTGPAGWSWAVRTIPFFREFAEDFQQLCPDAFIVNYSNPMAALTATLQQCCGNPVVGLCHAYFQTRRMIAWIFGRPDESSISLSVAGMNHFTWVVDFRLGREDGYRALREKVGDGSLRDLLPPEPEWLPIYRGWELFAELYDTFGYLPYPGDRHTAEFLSFTLSGFPERREVEAGLGAPMEVLPYCHLKRTPMAFRRRGLPEREAMMREYIAGTRPLPERTRERGAEMIHAYLHNGQVVEAINCLNAGQIEGLPRGACVETFGVVDGLGVHPVLVGPVAEPLLEVMRPQAVCQKWITEGVLTGNRDLLLQALYRDPQCAALQPAQVREMAGELFATNARFGKGG
jgi:alpha-galactosidase